MTEFQLTSTADHAQTHVLVTGELDLVSAPELERELQRILLAAASDVVLDLRGVTFIDSSGLRVVLVGSRDARASGRRFVVLAGEGQVRRVIDMAQVADHLELDDEVAG